MKYTYGTKYLMNDEKVIKQNATDPPWGHG